MVLRQLKLDNFRGYKNIVIDFDSGINVIIGRNDIGKSTILEALEIFFNSEKIKLDMDDLCVYCNETKIDIICCFDVEEDKIIIDSTNYTSCKEEYLLNQEGLLEIKKEWDCSKGKITVSCLKTYVTALYPKIYKNPLVQEKIQTLQKMYDECKDESGYIPEAKTKSAELRKAIYSRQLSEPIDKCLVDIDVSKEDAKNLWDSIDKQLPAFFLFESDRKNTDKDAEIQDPLKAVTKSVIMELDDEIKRMQEEVKVKVEEIGHRTIEKLGELDSEIAKDIKPIVTLKPIDSSFSFDLVSDNNIPLNKRGSGIRRLILLSYFRADAESADHKNKQIIYAIEEPETSQHPDFQKMILDTLIELSEKSTHQIIVTTHTPEIAKMVPLNNLIFLRRDQFESPSLVLNDAEKMKGIADTLGVLPYANTKTVIYVEGPNDVNFITNINQNIPELKNIIDLKSSGIQIIPLNGGRLVDWINKNYFDESNITEIYITDRDVQKYQDLIDEINLTNDGRRYGWSTKLQEIENYIPVYLVENEFGLDLKKYSGDWIYKDIPKILINLCMLEITDTKKRENDIKMILNGKISKVITKKDFESIGVWDEVEKWFNKIRDINSGSYRRKTMENT